MAVSTTAAATNALSSELAAVWRRRPFTVGIVGDEIRARTALLDRLCGGGFLDPTKRLPASAPLRLRRGGQTLFRTMRPDGTPEEHILPPPRGPRSDATPAVLRQRVEELRGEVNAKVAAAAQAERALPAVVRARPRPWAIWMWMIRWLLTWFSRDRIAKRDQAVQAVAEHRHKLRRAERELDTVETVPRDPHELFFDRLRIAISGSDAGTGLKEVELELASGPLPANLDVIELVAGWSRSRAEMDVIVTVADDSVRIAGESGRFIGTYDDAVDRLAAVAASSRAVRIARRARELIAAEGEALDAELTNAQREHRKRLERLEARRISDASRYLAGQLETTRPHIITSVSAVLEHASVHLNSELAQLGQAWATAVAAATSADELRVTAARIDDESAAELKRIAEETRLLVAGGIGGSAHDLIAPMVASLRAEGLPERALRVSKGSPPPQLLDMLPALTGSQGVRLSAELGGWLSGLFRSVDSRRADVLDKVRGRATHICEVAVAQLMDTEPRLHAALAELLNRELTQAMANQAAWLESAIAREREEIAREQKELGPLAKVCDGVRRDLRILGDLIADREA